ncbi:MAG: glycosyltransferase [Limnochordales bacterium]|nr:glycosyltransferase [Limnochordales bacterium]
MKVIAVIPTRNRARLLATCLESLREQLLPLAHVVVVDNGSTDETGRVVAQYPNARWIRLDRNCGVDGALAIGMEEALRAGADAVFISDDDSVALPSCLQTLVRTMLELNSIAVVNALPISDARGALIAARVHNGRIIRTKEEFIQTFGRLVPTNKVHFNGSLLSRSIIEAVGLPDARFWSGEETWYGERVRERGFDIVIDAEANVLHPPMPCRLVRIPLMGYVTAWDLPDWKARHYPRNALIRRRQKHGLSRFLLVDVPLVCFAYGLRLALERNRIRKAPLYVRGLLEGVWWGVRQRHHSG